MALEHFNDSCNHHEHFNDSYERCRKNPKFLHLFYDIFSGKDEKYSRMLDSIESIDNQIRMLDASIILIFMASTSKQAKISVKQLGKRHGPNGVCVTVTDYDVWFKSLLQTVELCDSEYSDLTEYIWTERFELGLNIMKEEC